MRQPLSGLLVSLNGETDLSRLQEYLPIIRDELNIKAVDASNEIDNYITYAGKLNFKAAGPKLGGKVKAVAPLVAALPSDIVRELAKTGTTKIDLDGENISLTTEEIEVIRNEREGYAVEIDGPVTIALKTELTEELRDEGFARGNG